jgi:hypothetical protein
LRPFLIWAFVPKISDPKKGKARLESLGQALNAIKKAEKKPGKGKDKEEEEEDEGDSDEDEEEDSDEDSDVLDSDDEDSDDDGSSKKKNKEGKGKEKEEEGEEDEDEEDEEDGENDMDVFKDDEVNKLRKKQEAFTSLFKDCVFWLGREVPKVTPKILLPPPSSLPSSFLHPISPVTLSLSVVSCVPLAPTYFFSGVA